MNTDEITRRLRDEIDSRRMQQVAERRRADIAAVANAIRDALDLLRGVLTAAAVTKFEVDVYVTQDDIEKATDGEAVWIRLGFRNGAGEKLEVTPFTIGRVDVPRYPVLWGAGENLRWLDGSTGATPRDALESLLSKLYGTRALAEALAKLAAGWETA